MVQIPRPTLYAIVDPSRCDGNHGENYVDAIEQFTRSVIGGGAGIVQLRAKERNARETYHIACRLAQVCAEVDVPFIVNDRLDIARCSGADGVHVGPEDVPVDAIRATVDDDFIIGASAGTPQAAMELQKQGADYLGVGAIYGARVSKPDASLPRGPGAIQSVTDAVDIPVIGIGGIDESNAGEVVGAGAHGVAVIRALTMGNPEKSARQLCDAMG